MSSNVTIQKVNEFWAEIHGQNFIYKVLLKLRAASENLTAIDYSLQSVTFDLFNILD